MFRASQQLIFIYQGNGREILLTCHKGGGGRHSRHSTSKQKERRKIRRTPYFSTLKKKGTYMCVCVQKRFLYLYSISISLYRYIVSVVSVRANQQLCPKLPLIHVCDVTNVWLMITAFRADMLRGLSRPPFTPCLLSATYRKPYFPSERRLFLS